MSDTFEPTARITADDTREHTAGEAAGQRVVIAQCPLCASRDSLEHARFAPFTWVRCRCGLVYKRSVAPGEPRPRPEDSFAGEGYGQRYSARWRQRVAKSRRQILDVLNHAPRGPLLDVGCSLGYTLLAARQLGLPASGADLSDVAVARCRELGFDARLAGMQALPWPDGTFALLTMKHVLEHTATPRIALREAGRVLGRGGGLFLAVPGAHYRKAVRAPLRSRFFRPDAHGGVEHWIYYTPATLGALLRQEGFEVAAVNEQLLHREAQGLARAAEYLAWPARRLASATRDAFALRKEFWLVALKR